MQEYATRRRNQIVAARAAEKAARECDWEGMSDATLLTLVQNALYDAQTSATMMGHIDKSIRAAQAQEALTEYRRREKQIGLFS